MEPDWYQRLEAVYGAGGVPIFPTPVLRYGETLTPTEDEKAALGSVLKVFYTECCLLHATYLSCVSGMQQEFNRNRPQWDKYGKQSQTYGVPVPSEDPNVINLTSLYSLPQAFLLEAHHSDGLFNKNVARMFIVLVYQMWDGNIRAKLSRLLRIDKNDVKCDIMNDLRNVRNDIVHNNGRIRDIRHYPILGDRWTATAGEWQLTTRDIDLLLIELLQAEIRLKA